VGERRKRDGWKWEGRGERMNERRRTENKKREEKETKVGEKRKNSGRQ